MTDLRKAAEMALEALESVYGKGKRCEAAIEALRQALAQPKREWVGLTEEEIFQAYKPEMEGMPFNKPTLAVIAGYIEAKLKEKNA